MVEGINKDLMSALATKTNVSNLVKPALNMVISNIPQKKDGKPVIQISTLWHILEVTMEIVEDIKNIKKLSGSQAKQMVITILKELIDEFAEEDVKDNCSDLLVNSIPAAIDMVINAANGKLKVNASVLDLNGDGKLNKEDINRCLSICKLLSCCGSRETAAVN